MSLIGVTQTVFHFSCIEIFPKMRTVRWLAAFETRFSSFLRKLRDFREIWEMQCQVSFNIEFFFFTSKSHPQAFYIWRISGLWNCAERHFRQIANLVYISKIVLMHAIISGRILFHMQQPFVRHISTPPCILINASNWILNSRILLLAIIRNNELLLSRRPTQITEFSVSSLSCVLIIILNYKIDINNDKILSFIFNRRRIFAEDKLQISRDIWWNATLPRHPISLT